jgi:hypothetical protein
MKRAIIILVLTILVDISHFLHVIPELGKTLNFKGSGPFHPPAMV